MAEAHDSKAVANFMLDLAKEDGEGLSPMKLIKLVYLAHGWHLGLLHKPLIRENVEAWKYGPVIPSLYHDFKAFGNEPITRYARWHDTSSGTLRLVEPKLRTATPQTLEVLRSVWRKYKKFSAVELSALTHRNGTPWDKAYNEGPGHLMMGTDIPINEIEKHFQELAATKPE